MSVLSRFKAELRAHRDKLAAEPMRAIALRTLRVGFEAGFVADMLRGKLTALPGLGPLLLREGLNIGALYPLYATIHVDRPALVDPWRDLTYGQAALEIEVLMEVLASEFGVGAGTPVVVMLQNRVEYLLIWMALSRLRARVVHGSWRQTPTELTFQLDHSGAKAIFCDDAGRESVEAVGRELVVIAVGQDVRPWSRASLSYAELLNRHERRPRPEPQKQTTPGSAPESGNIVYTSGTTGRPKGALRDLTSFGIVELFRILDGLPFEAADRHLIVAPLYHSAAQAFALLHVALGATLYLEPHFDPRQTLESLATRRIDSVFLVPTMISALLDLPANLFASFPTPALRALVSGAAPFPRRLRERAIARFGTTVVHDFYGATELGWVTLINGEEMLEHPGSVGRPLPGQQVRILDEEKRVLPKGERGRIYVRNAQTMAGYLGDEGATRQTMHEGWMTVDDLGYLDAEGYLYVVGRARDMVISGGVNLYPAEIEDVLARHDAVKEVAVVGVEDPRYGEALAAVVVLARPIDLAELEAHTRAHLSGYKVPRRWKVVDSLPRNPTGKVLKAELIEACERLDEKT